MLVDLYRSDDATEPGAPPAEPEEKSVAADPAHPSRPNLPPDPAASRHLRFGADLRMRRDNLVAIGTDLDGRRLPIRPCYLDGGRLAGRA